MGTYPSRNPEIVVSALIVGGDHSYEAIPVAREIIRTYKEKKVIQQVQPLVPEGKVTMNKEVLNEIVAARNRLP